MDPIQEAMQPRKRPIFTYDVPVTMDAKIRKVGLVKLTHEEQRDATERAANFNSMGGGLFYELAKASVAKVNGVKVTIADETLDRAWADMDPALRNMIVTEWKRLNMPKEEDQDSFIKSQQIEFD